MQTKGVIAIIAAIVIVIAAIAVYVNLNNDGGDEDEDILDKIGIIGAMDEEIATLKNAMEIKQITSVAEMDFYEGKLGNRDVVLVKSGIGKVNAGICAQLLISDHDVTAIINTGVAGSLDERLEIGDIVVSTDAVQYDFDHSATGYAKGEIPHTGKISFEADPTLRAMAIEAVKKCVPEVNVMEGRICTGDKFVASEEDIERIVSDFGGLCCEMEGGSVALVCYLNDVPFTIIRTASDKADGSSPEDFSKFEKMAAHRSASIVKYMIENL